MMCIILFTSMAKNLAIFTNYIFFICRPFHSGICLPFTDQSLALILKLISKSFIYFWCIRTKILQFDIFKQTT